MNTPTWLDPLFSADEMRAVDAWAIEHRGVPSLDLMERAGLGLARVVAEIAGGADPIRVVVGGGNNGGDGLVAARLLREDGRRVDVLATGDLNAASDDAVANLHVLPGDGPRPLTVAELEGSSAVVDCVLGTGFSGSAGAPASAAIEAMNGTGAPVVACDVPSGVDASSGRVEGPAVRAAATATFHGVKVGLRVAPGKVHAGRVEVIEIGVPRGGPDPPAAGLISARVLREVPVRAADGSKFTSGVVAIAGGARGLTGAPIMSALAAGRAGAGYVQVAVPASLEPILEARLLEAMTRGMPERDGSHRATGVDAFVEMSERAGAAVLGPGLGRSDGALEFARGVARAVERPLLIDADGLTAHAGELGSLRVRTAPTILTPHAGELARLLDTDSSSVDADRLGCVCKAADESRAIVVLKGDDTIVATPEGVIAISAGASPALATAGTGDVLSGTIGALLAKGVDPFTAAAAGVYIHARAGIAAGRRRGVGRVVAGDVVDQLGAAFEEAA